MSRKDAAMLIAGTAMSLAPCLAGEAFAQARKTVFAGVVYSGGSGTPLEGAQVIMLGSGRGAVTDASGYFRLEDVDSGTDSVEVRYLGYERNHEVVDILGQRLTQVVFLLTPSALELAELTVEVEPLRAAGKLARFEERRNRGFGHFLGPLDIERIAPQRTADVLRRIPGIIVSSVRFGRSNIRIGRGLSSCNPFVYLDGIPMPAFEFDDVSPQDLMAVEVYSGVASAPAEFSSRNNGCGVIAVWTKE
ncbi:MAG: TonB-dependent receptor [Gemmatimonadota bacterium]